MILVKEEVVDQALDKLVQKNRDALDKAYKQKRGNGQDRREPRKKRARESYNTKRHYNSRRRTRVGKKKTETRTIIVSGFGAQ